MDQGEEEQLGTGVEIYCCWKGIERSAKIAAAMRSIGRDAKHLIGGTNELHRVSDKKLLNALPESAHVTIIYDQGSRDEEFDDMRQAVARLERLGIPYEVKDTVSLFAELYSLGANLSEFL